MVTTKTCGTNNNLLVRCVQGRPVLGVHLEEVRGQSELDGDHGGFHQQAAGVAGVYRVPVRMQRVSKCFERTFAKTPT